MGNNPFELAQKEYEAKNYEAALNHYLDALKAGMGSSGEICHCIGNCFMKLHRYDDAITSYQRALKDPTYTKAGAIHFNLGNIYLVKKDNNEAVKAFQAALSTQGYDNSYKAYYSLGVALLRLNHIEEAAVAFRRSALESNNPTPAKALNKLASCFMSLKRPEDAYSSYCTALEFASDEQQHGNALVGLAQADAYLGKRDEAIDYFSKAEALTGYVLSDEARFEYDRLRGINVPEPEPVTTFIPDSTEPDVIETNLIPSAENTSFFTISEDELVKASKESLKAERKNRHIGLKLALVIILVIALLAGTAAVLFYVGYGYPSQESVVSDFFVAESAGQNVSSYWSDATSEETIEAVSTIIPKGSKIEVLSLNKSMNESDLVVAQTLDKGGILKYDIVMQRDGISWKLVSVTQVFDSAR